MQGTSITLYSQYSTINNISPKYVLHVAQLHAANRGIGQRALKVYYNVQGCISHKCTYCMLLMKSRRLQSECRTRSRAGRSNHTPCTMTLTGTCLW